MPAEISIMDRALRILHLEDSPHDRQLIHEILEAEGFATDITAVENRADFLNAINQQTFDLILSDQSLPTFDGFSALHLVRAKHPDLPFIFVTGSMGEEAAIQSIKDGATDYVLKDRLKRLIPAVERAIRESDQAQKTRLASEALRESEKRFQLVARASNDAIWDWNMIDNQCWYSEGFKHFGYRLEDIGTSRSFLLNRIHPDHQERVKQSITKILRSGEQFWSEDYPFRCSDGSWAHVFDRGYVIRNNQSEAVRMVGAMMDITQRKLAEQLMLERARLSALEAEISNAISGTASLKESLQRCTESVVRHLDVAFARIWTLNEPDRMLYLQASAGLYTHLDGPHSRIPLGQYKIGRIAKDCKAHISNSFSDDPQISDPAWAARENIIGFAGYPLVVSGQILGVIALFSRRPVNDFITDSLADVAKRVALGIERRHAEEKIREQAALLDKAQDAILVPGLNQQIRYWNKSAERLYGWTAHEAIGQDATKLLFNNDSPTVREARKTILEKGEWTGELIQVTKLGKELIVKSHWSLVRDPAGLPECILIVNTDITEKKKLEAQFLRAQRLENIGTLASGIAHDLNNVLAPILMGVSVLKDEIQDRSQLDLIDTIESSAARGAGMVRQILSFGRGAGGERALLQPNHLIKEIHKITQETFPKTIATRVQTATDCWNILCDPTQLHQVLLNLCVNARDAMPNGGTLTVSSKNVILKNPKSKAGLISPAGPYVQIEVSDTGSGMSEELQKQIFEPFFTTKELGKGTGLGLSTTVNILQNHGGLIDLQSTVGQGTKFIIHFPAQPEQTNLGQTHKPQALPSGKQELILLVDDELAIREMSKLILESCDYRVLTAENGAEAIALFERNREEIQLVVTDFLMPVMDGPTAIRAMRWSEPNLKVIATSGLSEKEQAQNQPDVKMDKFLQKPYTPEQLLHAVADLLKEKVDAEKK